MKNWRNSVNDISPPIEHADPSPRVTRLRLGSTAVLFLPGPDMVPVHPQIPLKDIIVTKD